MGHSRPLLLALVDLHRSPQLLMNPWFSSDGTRSFFLRGCPHVRHHLLSSTSSRSLLWFLLASSCSQAGMSLAPDSCLGITSLFGPPTGLWRHLPFLVDLQYIPLLPIARAHKGGGAYSAPYGSPLRRLFHLFQWDFSVGTSTSLLLVSHLLVVPWDF